MDKPVDHCSGHLVIRKDPSPFGEFQIGCQDQALALIAVRYNTEQQLGSVLIDWYISPFIQYEQVKAAEIPQKALQRPVFPRFRKLQHKFCYGIKLRLVTEIAGLYAGCDCHMGFTDAHWTVKHKILFPRDKLKGFQFLPAECRGKFYAVIAVPLKGLIGWEPGPFNQTFSSVFIPESQFRLQQFQKKLQLLLRPFSRQISEILPERKSCRLAPRICVQKSSFIFGVIMKQCLLPSETYHHILQGMGLPPAVYKCHIR